VVVEDSRSETERPCLGLCHSASASAPSRGSLPSRSPCFHISAVRVRRGSDAGASTNGRSVSRDECPGSFARKARRGTVTTDAVRESALSRSRQYCTRWADIARAKISAAHIDRRAWSGAARRSVCLARLCCPPQSRSRIPAAAQAMPLRRMRSRPASPLRPSSLPKPARTRAASSSAHMHLHFPHSSETTHLGVPADR
jgi:hypothetical protein